RSTPLARPLLPLSEGRCPSSAGRCAGTPSLPHRSTTPAGANSRRAAEWPPPALPEPASRLWSGVFFRRVPGARQVVHGGPPRPPPFSPRFSGNFARAEARRRSPGQLREIFSYPLGVPACPPPAASPCSDLTAL